MMYFVLASIVVFIAGFIGINVTGNHKNIWGCIFQIGLVLLIISVLCLFLL